MKPFDPPANSNTPAAAPMLWLLPMASYAATMDVMTYQLRYWAALNRAALDLSQTAWSLPARPIAAARNEAASPAMACAAADMRAAGAAMLQAQKDAMDALRRSA